MLDHAIEPGRGGVFLRLTPKQYARLRRIGILKATNMACEEYKQMESDKKMADEQALIDSANRHKWVARSAGLRKCLKAHKALCPVCKKRFAN
jgi:hypothetical protein